MSNHLDHTPSSNRYTIAFLTQESTHDSESSIFQGVNRAAEEYDVNLICFTPLNDSEVPDHSDSNRYNQLREHLHPFDLNGLIFISWSKFKGEDNERCLRDALHPIRLLSIGNNHSDMPSVQMNGGYYIRQLTRHLAEEHGCRNIAFISSYTDDDRLPSYRDTMQDLDCYDERLIVQTADLIGYDNHDERMTRALDILFIERSMPIDAIMVMSAYDGKYMLNELTNRGLKVPEDIALVCYEDIPMIEFSKPPLTTIYYPYEELGYQACTNLIKLLDGQDILHAQEVEAKVILRDSCGCALNKIMPVHAENSSTNPRKASIETRTTSIIIAQEMRNSFPNLESVDFEKLAGSFLTSVKQTNSDFLTTLEMEVRKLHILDNDILQAMVDRFRQLILPLVNQQTEIYDRAEMLWLMTRYILKDYNNSATITHYINNVERNHILRYVSQHILSVRNISELPEVLNNNLGWIQIPTQYVVLHTNKDESSSSIKLILAYDNYHNLTDYYSSDSTTTEVFHRYKENKQQRFSLVVIPIIVEGKSLGIIWSEPGNHGIELIFELCGSISKGIESSLVLEESRVLVKQLYAEAALRREKEAQLAYYADVDSLTDLFNRRYFYDTMSSITEAEPHFTLFYMDIDGFKKVNDTMGHDVGDELLIQIANRLIDALSDCTFPLARTMLQLENTQSTSLFRIGGDEFTALLITVDPEEIAHYARRTIESIHQPFYLSGRKVEISVSIGIALYPLNTTNTKLLLKYADSALYKAKEAKDSYIFYGN